MVLTFRARRWRRHLLTSRGAYGFAVRKCPPTACSRPACAVEGDCGVSFQLPVATA